MALTGKQKRTLRALGHHLQVVVHVGKAGVTKGLVASTAQALKTHELIKVKLEAEKEDRAEALDALAKQTGAQVAQALGKTALLFKQRKNKPKIKLDAPLKPAKGDVVAKAKHDDADDEAPADADADADADDADDADDSDDSDDDASDDDDADEETGPDDAEG